MITIEQSITDFLNHCRFEKNLSPKTLKFYGIDLRQFTVFIQQHEGVKEIIQVDKFILKAYLRELSSWKPKTVKRKIATLKALFNYLEYEDVIVVNPMRKIKIKIKEPFVLPKALTKAETGKLLSTAYKLVRQAPVNQFSKLEKIRNAALIELLFATGARVSEIANLRLDDIDFTTGRINIHGKGNKERITYICNQDALGSLRDYFDLFEPKITANGNTFWINRLHRKLSDQSIRAIVKNLTIDANLNKHVTPHVLRHTFATLLLENDVDIKYIQSLLGHSSISTTQIYTQVNREKQKSILLEKHPRGEMVLDG